MCIAHPNTIKDKIEYLRNYSGRPLRLMEVCGTHTAGIFKSGIRSILPGTVRLISGPGCPVCVTSASYIDKCVEIACTPGFALVSFGDMLKVPGSEDADGMPVSMDRAKGFGARVELVYSPFDALDMAGREPETRFVVAAVGFETTAPAYALLMDEAESRGITNISLLTSLKSAIPAIEWVCDSSSVDGFLCPGHVSVITGSIAYEPLAGKYGKPFVVAGFEGSHLVDAICELVSMAAREGSAVVNRYTEAVTEEGNARARAIVDRYFERGEAVWRGLGPLADSGLYLRPRYSGFDAGSRGLVQSAPAPKGCLCTDVITGRIDPPECPAFGSSCTPDNARGPCMASAEGACGIWHANGGLR
ncbi:MAG: hydrogenase formation protein HypD [Clostridiales Family XIII bacterium]|jgi:hydrogenase expression/formation protein HypD|nr:hydrogenase formation protein HypD [Clostridiales Family XIII bacterium]